MGFYKRSTRSGFGYNIVILNIFLIKSKKISFFVQEIRKKKKYLGIIRIRFDCYPRFRR